MKFLKLIWNKEYRPYSLMFLFLFTLLILRTFFFQIYIVQGSSMVPTLNNGQIIVIEKFLFPVKVPFVEMEIKIGNPEIKRMDIILLENQKKDLIIKRMIGLPHEYYSFIRGGVLIDSKPLEDEKSTIGETEPPTNSILSGFPESEFMPLLNSGRIPPDYFLLLGDNREYSSDSRSLGMIPLTKLRGKVLHIF